MCVTRREHSSGFNLGARASRSTTTIANGSSERTTGRQAPIARFATTPTTADHLIGVRAPGRILQNWFDESGRWIRQEVRSSEEDSDPYVATVRYTTAEGSIVQTDFDEGYGVQRVRYNSHHYIVSETLNADGPARLEMRRRTPSKP
jgi:hypothetical protein